MWLQAIAIVFLVIFGLVGLLALLLVVLGRRQYDTRADGVAEARRASKQGESGNGKKRNIRKRKVGNADAEADEFVVDRTEGGVHRVPPIANDRTEGEETPADVQTTSVNTTPQTDVTDTTEDVDIEPTTPTTPSRDRKALPPQSQPLPQPIDEEQPTPLQEQTPAKSAQEVFLSSCQNAPRCGECDTYFSLLYRRHHCRKCFRSVCAYCSPDMVPLAGFTEPVRVCNRCVKELNQVDEENRTSAEELKQAEDKEGVAQEANDEGEEEEEPSFPGDVPLPMTPDVGRAAGRDL